MRVLRPEIEIDAPAHLVIGGGGFAGLYAARALAAYPCASR
jgi:hypothetical protein